MNTNFSSFKMYFEVTTNLLIKLLDKFHTEVNESLNRLYELFIIIRARYYNFEFITEIEIVDELKELFEKSNNFKISLESVVSIYDDLKNRRMYVLDFVERNIASNGHDVVKSNNDIVDYLDKYKINNQIFDNLINVCQKEVDVMSMTFVNYNFLIEFKEPNSLDHYLRIVN